MTIEFLVQLALTAVGYAIIAWSYLGIGWAAARLLRIEFVAKEKIFALIWLGWASTLFLLQVLNLLFPINAFVSLPGLAAGAILAFAFLRTQSRTSAVPGLRPLYVVLLAAASLGIASLSMFAPTDYNSGLYHFGSIRWLNEYPIVLGLGNLHGRLAFNQSLFAYVAYLNVYPLFNRGYDIALGFLLLLLLAECLQHIFELRARGEAAQSPPIASITAVIFIPVLIYLGLNSSLSSPAPDTASSILQILVFIHFVRAVAAPAPATSDDSRLPFVLVMLATLLTLKLSNVSYVLGIAVVLFAIRLKGWRLPEQGHLRAMFRLAAFPALIVVVWAVRGVLLSGCPAYPSTMACVPVRWAVPIESVKRMSNLVYIWSRRPGSTSEQVLNSWAWFKPWLHRMQTNVWMRATVIYPLAISIAGLAAGILAYVLAPALRRPSTRLFLLPVPVLMGLVTWFYLAPAVRFANALFWILPVSFFMIIIETVGSTPRIKYGAMLAMFLVANASIAWIIDKKPQLVQGISSAGYAPVPEANLVQKTTSSGLEVWTPTEGDQCWDAALPCTPYFSTALMFNKGNWLPAFTSSDTWP